MADPQSEQSCAMSCPWQCLYEQQLCSSTSHAITIPPNTLKIGCISEQNNENNLLSNPFCFIFISNNGCKPLPAKGGRKDRGKFFQLRIISPFISSIGKPCASCLERSVNLLSIINVSFDLESAYAFHSQNSVIVRHVV